MAKVGRPSKYDPAYCEQVIELGKQGMSVVEIACEFGVARSTVEEAWPAAHPEFSEAFERARDESQAWWEKQGREGLSKAQFNAQVWSRSMSARFPKDWREKQQLEHSGTIGVDHSVRARAEIEEIFGPRAPLQIEGKTDG